MTRRIDTQTHKYGKIQYSYTMNKVKYGDKTYTLGQYASIKSMRVIKLQLNVPYTVLRCFAG